MQSSIDDNDVRCWRYVAIINTVASFLLLVTCGISSGVASAQQIQQVELKQLPWANLLEIMQDEHAAKKQQAQDAFIRQYEEMMDRLAELINSHAGEPFQGFIDERQLAAEVIGHFFASRKAIRALVVNVDAGPKRVLSDISPLGMYPNALALRQVGLNAVPEIFWELQAVPTDRLSDHAVELYAHVILDIYHPEFMGGHEEALRVIKGYRDRAWKKKNLDRLLAQMHDISKEKMTD